MRAVNATQLNTAAAKARASTRRTFQNPAQLGDEITDTAKYETATKINRMRWRVFITEQK